MSKAFSVRIKATDQGGGRDEGCFSACLSSAREGGQAVLRSRVVKKKIGTFFCCVLLLCFHAVAGASSGSLEEPTPSSIVENGMHARGQHLLMDLAGSSFEVLNDKEGVEAATLAIIEKTGMTLLGIQSYKLDPQGVSVVATLAESHLSIHTWPEWGKALIDLFTCGEKFNLQDAVPIVAEAYKGNLTMSTYSVLPRGDHLDGDPTALGAMKQQFQPLEIMGGHKYKQLVYEIQSPFQKISIWDHHDLLEDSYSKEVTRSLFLDNVQQSNVHDEERYHETLVHPAFVASSHPVKRVLVVGGGEGGTLRECLKWKSVETVTMVDLDADVIRASRQYLPSYNNCTGFGTPDCFQDKRLELFTKDFFDWFDEVFGDDVCEVQDDKEIQASLYDIIILDLLDVEELPADEPWAAELYSSAFFERLSCALSPSGVLVTNFGEAPESPYYSGPTEMKQLEMFQSKIQKIQAMSSHFLGFTVYDNFIPSFRGQWAFAIGMGPTKTTPVRDESRGGTRSANTAALFDGTPEEINFKLRAGLKPGTHPLKSYSGRLQNTFRYSTAGWRDIYCTTNKDICDLVKQKGSLSVNCQNVDLRVSECSASAENCRDPLLDDAGKQESVYVFLPWFVFR